MSPCRACGAELRPDDRFCPACGTPVMETAGASLQVPAGGTHALVEDRRVVTVLFADLTGSTAIAEKLDPEAMRTLLGDLFAALGSEIIRAGGTVDKYIGDAIMAVFGAPVAHEDDPARAVAAALAMQRAMPGLSADVERTHGARLALRIGINSGEVVAGPLAGRVQAAYTVVGDTVNTAQRIQSAARPGEILVGAHTREAVVRSFDLEEHPPVTAKGKSAAVPVWRVRGARSTRTGTAAARPGPAAVASTPLLGRGRELEELTARVALLRGHEGGIVALIGEPGIGKSRLLAEMRRRAEADGVRWLEGRASAAGGEIPYGPFIEVLRTDAGLAEERPAHAQWPTLEARIRSLVPDEHSEILPYVGTLLLGEIPEERREQIRYLDREGIRRQVFRAVHVLLERIAAERPTVLALEDWHWADRSSEQLLEHVLPLHERLLIVWTGRSEPDSPAARLSRRCAASAAARYRELVLAPLPADASGALVAALLDDPATPHDVRHALTERAGGNPLFVEELVRSLLDLGVLTRDLATGWHLTPGPEARMLPTTVRGLIAARVDRLPDAAKEVARVASVVGRTFSSDLLQAAAGPMRGLDEGLLELQHAGLISGSRGAPDERYEFRHALVQQSVYEGILLRRRRGLHRAVAQAIEARARDELVDRSPVLAYHYAHAEDWEKAQEFLLLAGDAAGRKAAGAEAADAYEQALVAYQRAFGGRLDALRRAEIERKIGEARFQLGEYERAEHHLGRALELVGRPRPRTRTRLRLAILAETARQIRNRLLARGFVERAEASPERAEALRALWWLGLIHILGDPEAILHTVLETLNVAEAGPTTPHTVQSYTAMGYLCHNVGLRRLGSAYHRRAIAAAARIGSNRSAVAMGELARSLDEFGFGDWDRALDATVRAAAGFREVGELRLSIQCDTTRLAILCARGEHDAVVDAAQRWLDLGIRTGDPHIEAWGHQFLGRVLGRVGRHGEAAEHLRRALDIGLNIPSYVFAAWVGGHLAETLLIAGDLDGARAASAEVEDLIHRRKLLGWFLGDAMRSAAQLALAGAESETTERRRDALRRAQRLCARAEKQSRLQLEPRAGACRVMGTCEWLHGRHGAARAWWGRSLEAAARAGALWEEALTRREIGRRAGSAEDTAAADAILSRVGASLG